MIMKRISYKEVDRYKDVNYKLVSSILKDQVSDYLRSDILTSIVVLQGCVIKLLQPHFMNEEEIFDVIEDLKWSYNLIIFLKSSLRNEIILSFFDFINDLKLYCDELENYEMSNNLKMFKKRLFEKSFYNRNFNKI